jgi:hypothetical protein
MTRTQLIDLAKSGIGYSYYWGHGSWRTDGTQHGSCSANSGSTGCPGCTHSGQYGADCSGFAAKVWQIPSPIAVDVDKHPYATGNFYSDMTYWKEITWNELKPGDAAVHNNGSSGHIVIWEKGDPWGQSWVYECKGCSYGCVHDTKTLTSDYKAIRRTLVTDDPVDAGTDSGSNVDSSVDSGTPKPDAAADSGSTLDSSVDSSPSNHDSSTDSGSSSSDAQLDSAQPPTDDASVSDSASSDSVSADSGPAKDSGSAAQPDSQASSDASGGTIEQSPASGDGGCSCGLVGTPRSSRGLCSGGLLACLALLGIGLRRKRRAGYTNLPI